MDINDIAYVEECILQYPAQIPSRTKKIPSFPGKKTMPTNMFHKIRWKRNQ